MPSSRPPAPVLPGPVLLLLPLLLLAVAVRLQRGYREEPGAPPEAPPSGGPESVEGWVGATELAGAGSLSARLRPLHADPERQRFDARSLSRRLDLGAGEPWSLVLSLEGPADSALDLRGLRITGGGAAALRTLVELSPVDAHPAAPGGIVDPLWGALAAQKELRPETPARLVLWGTAPEGALELRGPFGALELYREPVAVDADEAVLARLEEDA